MLVLSRKILQSVIIEKDIEIRVLSVNGNQVKLGISAPDDVLILRAEVAERQRVQRSGSRE